MGASSPIPVLVCEEILLTHSSTVTVGFWVGSYHTTAGSRTRAYIAIASDRDKTDLGDCWRKAVEMKGLG